MMIGDGVAFQCFCLPPSSGRGGGRTNLYTAFNFNSIDQLVTRCLIQKSIDYGGLERVGPTASICSIRLQR